MIEWIDLNFKQPPVNEKVLTMRKIDNEIYIETDRLNFGKNEKYSDLLFWDSGIDYDEISHWAKFPEIKLVIM